MVIFHGYVKKPEGNELQIWALVRGKHHGKHLP